MRYHLFTFTLDVPNRNQKLPNRSSSATNLLLCSMCLFCVWQDFMKPALHELN